MLKNMGLTRRAVLGVLLLDVLFTPLFAFAYAYLTMTSVARAAAIMAPLFVVRMLIVGAVAVAVTKPTDSIHRTLASKKGKVSAEALRRADSLLQRGPLLVTASEGLLWGGQVLIITLVESLAGDVMHSGVVAVSITMALAGTTGSFGICFPTAGWIYGPFLGQNAVAARKLGIDLERSPSSIPRRIMAMAMFLCVAPTLLMMALGSAVQARTIDEQAKLEAELILSDLSQHQQDPGSAPDRLAGDRRGSRATLFASDASGTLRTSGATAPAWLDASWVQRAATGQTIEAAPGEFARISPLPDGSRIGAITRSGGASSEYLTTAAIIAMILAFWGPLCAWVLSRSVAAPLETAAAATRRIVEDGDLSKIGNLPVEQNDEVGLVLSGMNELIDTMTELSTAAAAIGAGNMQTPIRGEGELPDAFRTMVENLRQAVQQMHGTATELGSAATEIFAATQEQEAAATSHSSGMVEITQTMDSLSKSAAHVADAVHGVLQNAERTLENTDQMVARISTLTGQANRIADILEVIREIADRTDLLALNGSLEATRAGESGRGFALVAAEMRRLAERVTASVEDIKQLVAEIRESGASTVVATEESRKLAQKTTEAARTITLVSQQQRTSTEQVSQSVRGVAEVVDQAATATMQTRSSAEGLKLHADRLSALVQRFQVQA